MNLGFKDQFVGYVREGSKRHTIRGGERWKAGMRADLFEKTRKPKEWASFCTHSKCGESGAGVLDACPRCGAPMTTNQVDLDRFHLHHRRAEDKRHAAPVRVPPLLALIAIEGEPLLDDEANQLAFRDGFRTRVVGAGNLQSLMAMSAFWRKEHGLAVFTGQFVHWDYDERFEDKADTCFHLTRSQAKGHLV